MTLYVAPTIADATPFDPTDVAGGFTGYAAAINGALDGNNLVVGSDFTARVAHKGHFVDPSHNESLGTNTLLAFFNTGTGPQPWGSNTNEYVVASNRFYLKEQTDVMLSAWFAASRWKSSWVTPANTMQVYADYYLQLDGVTVRTGRDVMTLTDVDDQPGLHFGLQGISTAVAAGAHDVSLLLSLAQSSTSIATGSIAAQFTNYGTACTAQAMYK